MRAILIGLLALFALGTSSAQDTRPVVYLVPVGGVIDLGLAPLVGRVLDEAAQAGAAAVILDINTFGGRVDAAVLIRDSLLHARVPTVAFVNKRAISAGALIALAAEKVAMADGCTIGAATPVARDPPTSAVPRKQPARRTPRDRSCDSSRPVPRSGSFRQSSTELTLGTTNQCFEKVVLAGEAIARSTESIQLRYLGTLANIAGETSSTIVFRLPIDLLSLLWGKA